MYIIKEAMDIVMTNQTFVIIAAFITYGFGFIQYFSSIYMQVKHKQAPFYFWQHCWYIGHDMTFSLLFRQWFYEIDFWLFKVLCIGCMIFVGIELFSLWFAVKYERQEIWGKYTHKEVTEKEAWVRGILGYIVGIILFASIRLAIGDVMCLVLMMSTNATLALAAPLRLEEVGVQKKGIRVLSWATLFGTIFTFAPSGVGFFATVIQVLNAPWFFLVGIVCVLSAARFVYLSYKLPKAEA